MNILSPLKFFLLPFNELWLTEIVPTFQDKQNVVKKAYESKVNVPNFCSTKLGGSDEKQSSQSFNKST